MRTDGGASRRVRRAVAASLLAVGWLLATSVPASAHDHLISMSPAAGSRDAQVPAEVSLTFDAAVGSLGSSVVVTDPAGQRIDARVPEVTDRTIGVSLSVPATPLRGTYTVDYRVVSADGHVVSDHESFEVTTGAVPATTAAAGPGGSATHSAGFFGAHAGHVVLVAGIAVLALAYVAFDLVRRRAADRRR